MARVSTPHRSPRPSCTCRESASADKGVAKTRIAGGFDMTPPTGWMQPPAPAPGNAWAPRAQVEPAPGIVFGGFWIRFVAFYVDAILVESIVMLLVLAFIPSIAGVLLVSMIVMPAYFIGFWATTGQTIGMKLLACGWCATPTAAGSASAVPSF